MSLQDAIYLSDSYGTSSGGVLPTNYIKPWENQGHKESDISPEISNPSNDDATGLGGRYGLPSSIRNLSDVDMWWRIYLNYEVSSDLPNISKLSNLFNLDDTNIEFNRQKITRLVRAIRSFYADMPERSSMWWNTSPISYIVTTEQQKIVDTTMRRNVNRILQQGDFTTAYINWHRLYASQETLQDSQKRKISERFAVLAQREDDWDKRGSKKPTQPILVHADHLIEEVRNTITSAGHEWLTPFISSDEDGYITVSWYREKRTLHIEIEENEAEYTKVWSVNTNMKMEADFLDRDNYLTLWKWLLDE